MISLTVLLTKHKEVAAIMACVAKLAPPPPLLPAPVIHLYHTGPLDARGHRIAARVIASGGYVVRR